MNKPLLILLACLPACAPVRPESPPPPPLICDVAAKPDRLSLKDTPPTLVLGPGDAWGYWFSADKYAALAENIQAMRLWMAQDRAIRDALVECIEDHNAMLEIIQ